LSARHRIKNISVQILKAELNQPFRTALGTHDYLENILFGIELEDKTKGWGEAAVATHITGETLRQTLDNLERIKKQLLGESPARVEEISQRFHQILSSNPCAIAAIETALLDALTRQERMPLWRFFGRRCHKLTSDITIVLAGLKETESSVKKYFRQGFRAFKVKIGRDMDLDFKRLEIVKRSAPRSRIYLDANQGYTADEMLKFLKLLEKGKIKIDLLEQPVPKDDWEGLKRISRSTTIPVCADESVRTMDDARKIIKQKLVPVINIKIMKCGIVHACKIARLARASGIKLMIGGMMETSLAMTASAHLAAGLGCFDYIDLDTPFFIKGGLKGNSYLSSDGQYDLRKVKAGVGIILQGL